MKRICALLALAVATFVLAACTTESSLNNPANPAGTPTGNTQRYTNQGGHTDSAPNTSPKPQY